MKCPKCKSKHYCGCKSCKPRKGMHRLRSNKMKGDFITCAYCRTKSHFDAWLDAEAATIIKL